jgi:hypothetical protein
MGVVNIAVSTYAGLHWPALMQERLAERIDKMYGLVAHGGRLTVGDDPAAIDAAAAAAIDSDINQETDLRLDEYVVLLFSPFFFLLPEERPEAPTYHSHSPLFYYPLFLEKP